MEQVKELVAKVVSQLSDSDLAAVHPELVLEKKTSSHDLLVHLHGHLNFHLGQIDYLRRILTEGSAVAFRAGCKTMSRFVYLHGFASSPSSGRLASLRSAFASWESAWKSRTWRRVISGT